MRSLQRLLEPVVNCTRCGERFYSSWKRDFKCPKCGRKPAKVQLWEAALCALFPPAALVSAVIHRKDSPRQTLYVLLLGLVGTGIYFLALHH